jgi:hypothetical protein
MHEFRFAGGELAEAVMRSLNAIRRKRCLESRAEHAIAPMPDFSGDGHAPLAGEPGPGLADCGPGALVGFDEVFTDGKIGSGERNG